MMYNQPPFLTFNCPPHLSYIQGLDRSAKPNPCSKSSPVMNLILYFFFPSIYDAFLGFSSHKIVFGPRIGWARPSSSQTATIFKETKFRFAASVTHGMDCLLFECKLPLITRPLPPPPYISENPVFRKLHHGSGLGNTTSKKKKNFFLYLYITDL